MDCQRVSDEELVERYLNGRLDEAAQDDLEVHILECPECLARAEALSAIRTNLLPREAKREAKAGPLATTDRRRQAAWMGVAAAALVAMCLLGFYLLRSTTPKPVQTASPQATPSEVVPAHRATAQNDSTQDNSTQNTGMQAHAPAPPGSSARKQAAVAGNAAHHASTGTVARVGVDQSPRPKPEQTNPQKTVVAEHGGSEAGGVTLDFAQHKSSLAEMSQGTSVEFYALAAVQPPPPYESLSSSESAPDGGASSGLLNSLLPAGRTLFQDAMVAYGEKRYSDAAKLLDSIVAATPESLVPNFYLGICKLVEDHPNDAIEPLKTVASAPAGPLTQASHFYLAKAYLRIGDMARAESEMQTAANMQGRLTAQARSIAERIHALRNSNAQGSPRK